MPNRLAAESSLYLRQHADNPVDWFPWGDEAFARAKELDRPIFLSVGYSACHWCHVMAHECFESEAIGALLNDHFVCVKVDREERPDVDQVYMTAHHLLNRGDGGGWPLSVFLTPDRTPFYAGTYFPPDDRYAPQRPSFPRLLHAVHTNWTTKKDQLTDIGRQVAAHIRVTDRPRAADTDTPLSLDLIERAGRSLKRSFDAVNGGFGSAPKFPHPLEVGLLLRLAARDSQGWATLSESGRAAADSRRESATLSMATLTLDRMARGGMFDQVGGGFHRYSVDAVWLVPHFEKMLYDNALLPPVYADAFRLTGDPFYRQVACETLDYVLKEMTHADGGFFSTQDADSEGEEGVFYTWSERELDEVLGPDLGRLAKAVYGVTAAGNFEGKNIPFRSRTDADDARLQRLSLDEFRMKLADIRAKLYAARLKRVWPGRDEKVLAAWNGLMISAMAHCGAALNEPKYTQAAVRAAEFVLANLRTDYGRLLRTWGEGVGAKLNAYLEDYAYLTDAFVTLYQSTFDPKWLRTAGELADAMLKSFADPAGGFFFTADDHETVLARTKDVQDASGPSGNAVAATAMLKLSKLTGRTDLFAAAEGVLKAYHHLLGDTPLAAGQLLAALDFHLGPVDEVAVVGRADDPDTQEVLRHLRSQYRPNRVVAFHDPTNGEPEVPLLRHKPMVDGQVTVYVCRDFSCRAPLVGADAAKAGV